jgi:hypothetical protein
VLGRPEKEAELTIEAGAFSEELIDALFEEVIVPAAARLTAGR